MRGLFWLLALFAAAAGLALAARVNDGYVLLVFPPWRLEISLNLLLLLLVASFAVLHLLLRALSLALALPKRVSAFREQRSRDKAAATFLDALRLFLEGRYGQSLKRAGEASAAGYARGLSALLAAKAAHAMRETDKEADWLHRATQDDSAARNAAWMLEAEMQLENRQFDAAAEALRQLHENSGRHIAALRLDLKVQQGRKDWEQVLRLVRQLEKRDALAPELAREIKLKAHRENLRLRQGDAGQLLAYLKALPNSETTPRLAASVAEALFKLGAHAEAQRIVEAQLEKAEGDDWNPDLVRLYGESLDGDATARIARAEKWLGQRPQDAGLLLALGRLCLQQRLWGKAQNYLEASLSVEESRDAHLELARLFDQLKRPEEANRHYRESARPGLCQ